MGILRKASQETKRIPLGEDGEDWLEVKSDLSKRDFNALIAYFPQRTVSEGDTLSVGEALEASKGIFSALVVGWSLPEPPTIDSYLDLSQEAASAIDVALSQHFESLTPTRAEGKAPTT